MVRQNLWAAVCVVVAGFDFSSGIVNNSDRAVFCGCDCIGCAVYSALKRACWVQSVALRIIVDREQDIRKFKPQEYWTLLLDLSTRKKENFSANLISFQKQKMDANAKINGKIASEAEKFLLKNREMIVSNITEKDIKQTPPVPFITSSLQQEASNKIGFSPKKTPANGSVKVQ